MPTELPSPPQWSLLAGSCGRALIIFAAIAFTISGLAWIFAPKSKAGQMVGVWALHIGNWAILGTFACLASLFVGNRFEYEYVYGHTDTKNALAYRIAGVWSGQEGSFLLWASCAAIFALLSSHKVGKFRRWYSVATAVVLGSLTSIIVFESPFNLNLMDGKPFVPAEGVGLSPALQNYWVTIHPPVIFLGFGALTVLFALAFAALMEKDLDSWIPVVRPWSIVCLTLVGLGLCMGGFWAYETLGWGGFWMWDPVENVSFVPWCFAIAFSHGVMVQTTRNKWKIANALLAGLPFLVFVYGTFLTRSGFLSEASVHSFAEMDRSALKLLIGVMGLTTIGFTGLLVTRAVQMRKELATEENKGLTRESFFFYGIWGLVIMGIATMVGMSVPFLQGLMGKKAATVPEALYHQVLPWIFVPIMVLMALTPFASWRKLEKKEFWTKIYTLLCVTVGVTGVLLFATLQFGGRELLDLSPKMTMVGKQIGNGLPWMLFLVGLCVFGLVASTWKAGELWKRSLMGTGGFVAHIGVGVLMMGLIVSRGFERKEDTMVMKGHPGRALNYEIVYKGMTSDEHDRDNRLQLEMFRIDGNAKMDAKGQPAANKKLYTAEPGVYKTMMGDQENTMVWPSIKRGVFYDTYVSLGQPQEPMGRDISLQPGKKLDLEGLSITYKKMTTVGQMGQAGTQFGADLVVNYQGKELKLNPTMELGASGDVRNVPAPLDENLEIVMTGINAADKSANLRIQMTGEIYPVEVYHKPLTSFVWLGTTIMTIGGLMAAWYRSPRKAKAPATAPIPATAKSTT